VLFIATLLSEAGRIELSRTSGEAEGGRYVVSVATIPHLASALLLPPAAAAALAGVSMLVDELRGRSPLPRLLFNVAATSLSVGTAALEANLLGVAGDRLADNNWQTVLAFFLVAGTYYVVNTLPVVAITTIASGGSFWRLLATNARFSAPAEFAVAVVGGLAAHVWVHSPSWVLVGIFPAVISHLAFRSIGARNHKADQIAALDRLARALSAAFTVEEVFAAATAHLRTRDRMAGCFVHLVDPPVRLANGFSVDSDRHTVPQNVVDQVRATGVAAWVRDEDGHAAPAGDDTVTEMEWLVVPLPGSTPASGCVGIGRGRDRFELEDREMFGLVAEQIAVALENARRADELAHLAYHDALTGLPNRVYLTEQLEQALRQAAPQDRPVAVLFVGLNRFKDINDAFGHRYGDLVLQEIGRRLVQELPPSGTLARLSGDEFAVLLPDVRAEQAVRVAERLQGALKRSVEVQEVRLDATASIGIAVAPEHGADADLLQRRADVAMYVAKRSGGDYALYSPDQDEHSRDRLELAADLRRAVERGELRLHYQPIVSIDTGRMEEVEALLRWQHPQRGLVPPGQFIPLAEETGIIIQIGRWVFEEAARQAVAWTTSHPSARSLVMSVNVSARQFAHTDVPAEISDVLRKTGLDPRMLKLEITESIAMGDAELNIAALWLLKGMGLRLAIDDFGTGYSSLSYLKRFPVDTLKIDKAFIDGLEVHAEDTALVAAIIAFAHAVGLSTTAEGVEHLEQLAKLRELGADRVQGYYCSKPLPAEALEELLRTPGPLLPTEPDERVLHEMDSRDRARPPRAA
jgi:diguanylate cyclase (GGDEF)-like protein